MSTFITPLDSSARLQLSSCGDLTPDSCGKTTRRASFRYSVLRACTENSPNEFPFDPSLRIAAKLSCSESLEYECLSTILKANRLSAACYFKSKAKLAGYRILESESAYRKLLEDLLRVRSIAFFLDLGGKFLDDDKRRTPLEEIQSLERTDPSLQESAGEIPACLES